MALWPLWYDAIRTLRPAFSRERTFLWFVVTVMGTSVRTDPLGLTSIVRALGLRASTYHSLRECMHSKGIDRDALARLWVRCVFSIFDTRVERVNGRAVLLADGKKIAKEGRKMPAVKRLHQESGDNAKPSFIRGHSCQAVSLLVNASAGAFAVPLDIRIHEGLVFSNRCKKTLLDKLLGLVENLSLPGSHYLVADAAYANGKMIKGTLAQGHHLVTRVRTDAVAFELPPDVPPGERRRGRPRKYGQKRKLKALFDDSYVAAQSMPSPVYGERGVTLTVRTCTLLWRPAARLVRFVLVEHPERGRIMLLTSDLELAVEDVIRLYGLRFKIELGFKQASQVVGAFDHHYWMRDMVPSGRRLGEQYLHRTSADYRAQVRAKMHAYQVHLFKGVVAQGLMQYLSVCHAALVWRSFGSWLRTIREGAVPSERVVALALTNALPEFLLGCARESVLAKFLIERQDRTRAGVLGLAA